ncbi:phospholipase A1-Igamma1, chloroplastic [Cryptomeria japonica]|uniref:phospholipase A1-Igamma1, chloroplastic n=1 Tax=Cryptomeria japonica TaxID=3369 RepID=UPI0027DA8EC2|nr:phospholipase A1-Igamma1, chloroplastic [Cryptomeria japonica]
MEEVRGFVMEEAKKADSLAVMWREIQGANNWEGLLDPFNPILKKEVIKYGEFAQLCYDYFDCNAYSKNYGKCRYSRREWFQQEEVPSYGYEITKYVYACTHVHLPRYFLRCLAPVTWKSEATWMGFIAVVKEKEKIERLGRRDIVVAWRGSETSLEWVEDLHNWLVPAGFEDEEEDNESIMVESGFLNVYTAEIKNAKHNHRSARELVLTEIRRLLQEHKNEELSITLCGHSLGAALALLSAYDIGLMVANLKCHISITVFAFGCPRVGNKTFVDRIDSLNIKVLRIVNVNDMVTRVPGIMLNENIQLLNFLKFVLDWIPLFYYHAGVEIYVDSESSPYLKHTRNLVFHHSLEVYLHLLDGSIGEGKAFRSAGRDPALVNKYCDLLVDKLFIPPYWWQEAYKGLVKNEEGRWSQRNREEDSDDDTSQCD